MTCSSSFNRCFCQTVRALYDYRAQRADELSFCKHALIINVEKHDGGWWKGDYNGMSQRWFPSNYVEEVEMEAAKVVGWCLVICLLTEMEMLQESPLGSVQQGSVDVHGCHVGMYALCLYATTFDCL